MDGGTFDRLTRLLAGRFSRRAGLAASAAALALPAAAAGKQNGGGRRGHGHGHDRGRGPKPEGPCGDGSRKANVCTRDSQCCTGYCKTSLGRKNEDRKGRCRCVRRGKACTPKQTCCGKTECVNGVCAAPPPPVCQPSGGACAADADCCSCLACVAGACAPCVPVVCASGCAFDTVGEAYAAAKPGDTIYIGPGTYPTAITIDKDITLAACPCDSGVKLTVDRTTPSPDTYYSILADSLTDATAHSVTVRNLTLEGTYPSNSDDVLLRSNRQEKTDWTVENCNLRNAYYGIWAPSGKIVFTGGTVENCSTGVNASYEDATTPLSLVMTGVTVTGCDSYGVYFDPWDASPASFATVTGCTIRDNPGYGMSLSGDMGVPPANVSTVTNCTFTGNGGGSNEALYLYGGVATVTGCTITGNTGGGVFLYDSEATITDTVIRDNDSDDGAGIDMMAHNRTLTTLTMAGSTVVTGNTATGAGGGIYLSRNNVSVNYSIVGAGPRVTGNSPDQCYDGYNGAVVDCATWT